MLYPKPWSLVQVLQELACSMACFPLRAGSDTVGHYSVAPGVHLTRHHKMKQIFSRLSLWHISRRGPSFVWHGRNMGSQAAAMEEMEAHEINESKYHRWQEYETKVLIAAKNQHDLRKLEIAEAAGVELKKFRNSWKEIEAMCKQRGVQRSAEQCMTRWRRLILTYLRLKSWDENKTLDLSSFWSMKLDERTACMKLDEKTATGVFLGSMDQATYSLLDEFYNSRVDTVKDSLFEDAGEEIHEIRSVENLLPGMHLSSKEKLEVGGVPNADIVNEKQVEWVEVVGVGEAHEGRLTSQFSSTGWKVYHERQSRQVSGSAALAQENLLPSQECQGLDTMPEDNTGSTSKAISAGQLPCANDEGLLNQETHSTGAEVSNEMPSGQVSDSEVSKSTHVVVNTTSGVQESMSKDSLSLPFQKSQEMHVLEDSRHYSRVVSDGHLQSGIVEGSPNQGMESTGAKVFNEMQSDRRESTKSSAVAIDSCGVQETPLEDKFWLHSQECQIKTDRLSAAIKEDESHREMVEERDGTSEQRSLDVVSGEVCEGPGTKAVESLGTDAKVGTKDGTQSPKMSTEGSVKEQALQLYDGGKYDKDVFMYVPAAIGNVIRSVSQTFKKLFKS